MPCRCYRSPLGSGPSASPRRAVRARIAVRTCTLAHDAFVSLPVHPGLTCPCCGILQTRPRSPGPDRCGQGPGLSGPGASDGWKTHVRPSSLWGVGRFSMAEKPHVPTTATHLVVPRRSGSRLEVAGVSCSLGAPGVSFRTGRLRLNASWRKRCSARAPPEIWWIKRGRGGGLNSLLGRPP